MVESKQNVYIYLMKSKKRKKKRSYVSKLLLYIELGVLFPLVLLFITNQIINTSTQKHLYHSIDQLPDNRVGLVLGTSPRIRDGSSNPYFNNRMEAAAKLFHNKKVEYLIVSGDNRSRYYNEPEYMRQALIELGVPSSSIFPDHAGIRTYESIMRARDVFGQTDITIISQKFHNQRAVYIARQKGMDAVAFNAADVYQEVNDRTRIREWFAKSKVFWDLFFQTDTDYADDTIVIGQQ